MGALISAIQALQLMAQASQLGTQIVSDWTKGTAPTADQLAAWDQALAAAVQARQTAEQQLLNDLPPEPLS